MTATQQSILNVLNEPGRFLTQLNGCGIVTNADGIIFTVCPWNVVASLVYREWVKQQARELHDGRLAALELAITPRGMDALSKRESLELRRDCIAAGRNTPRLGGMP